MFISREEVNEILSRLRRIDDSVAYLRSRTNAAEVPVNNTPSIAPPMEPEPVMWGYNGRPQTDGNITFEKSNQPQDLWMVNGQPFTFRVHVPEGRVLGEITSRPTPRLGYPDPSLHRHEVTALGFTFPVSGHWDFMGNPSMTHLKFGPGFHTITVESSGFTGGVVWQFYYR